MKIYKLQLNVTLIEQVEKPEESPDPEATDPASSVDPVKRTDKFNDRVLEMMDKISKGNLRLPSLGPLPSPASSNVSRTFDIPAESFEEAERAVNELMALCHKLGMPSHEGLGYLSAYPIR